MYNYIRISGTVLVEVTDISVNTRHLLDIEYLFIRPFIISTFVVVQEFQCLKRSLVNVVCPQPLTLYRRRHGVYSLGTLV